MLIISNNSQFKLKLKCQKLIYLWSYTITVGLITFEECE